jgi:uncharacterized repeat protein (TIGR03806 family)
MKRNYVYSFLILLSVATIFISCSKEDDYVPIQDILPVASDDVIANELVAAVEIPILQNDVTGDAVVPSTITIIGGTDTNADGTLDRLEILNQGVWTVNAVTGVITFTPISGFVGNPTPISYTVNDAQNNTSNIATITINALPIVNLDLTQVPFPTLSSYRFFVGAMKNQIPSLNLIPFAPASSLFSDYAHKKRFVWMPLGSKATFNGDDKVLNLPVGAALVKTFYYDNVQPSNTTRIIETRVMIRKSTGWTFADYVWNSEQTEAYLDLDGSFTYVEWKDEHNVIKSTNYRIPSDAQCIICHKSKETVDGVEHTIYIPIGIKPQNLNWSYNYSSGAKNQLTKWIEQGYLDSNFAYPTPENTTVDYNDTSKSLDLRARSYVDTNCSHCHQTDRHCDYRPMRFAFKETGNSNGLTNMGVCVSTQDMQDLPPELNRIVTPSRPDQSMLFYRINTTDPTYRMPLHGRTIIHDEGVALMRDWINSLHNCD